jgi:hypothetical protein
MKAEANVVFPEDDAPKGIHIGDMFYLELFDEDYECIVMGIFRAHGKVAIRFDLRTAEEVFGEKSEE